MATQHSAGPGRRGYRGRHLGRDLSRFASSARMTPARVEAACDFDVVTMNEVSRYYGRRRALVRATLELRRGAMIGLFGPNGAGKSTILGVLSTQIQPSRGHVHY